MGNNIALNHPGSEFPNQGHVRLSPEAAAQGPVLIDFTAGSGKGILPSAERNIVTRNTFFETVLSVGSIIFYPVKIIFLFAVSVVYFLGAGVAAGIYLVVFEKLLKTLLTGLRLKRHRSQYYYRWKNHHLEFDYEV